jgi:arylsulfatase
MSSRKLFSIFSNSYTITFSSFDHTIPVPTVLELLEIDPPTTIKGVTQSPIEGVSFAHTLDNADAPTKHLTQYFEMFGHRSIYHDGWRAVSPWPGPSFAEAGQFFGAPISAEKLTELDTHGWELYHVAEDFAENHNIAADNRPKLIELISTWYVEAGKYKVLPIDARGLQRFALEERPTIAVNRTRYKYYPHTQPISANSAVKVLNRPHSITADVEIPPGGAEGILLVQGAGEAGYAFYIKGGKLHWVHNYVGRSLYLVESVEPVPEGRHQLRFEFEVTGPPDLATGKGTSGRAQLYIDGQLVGNADVPVTTPLSLSISSGLNVGIAPGSPVTPDYQPPFAFTGTIHDVVVDVSGELIQDSEAELRAILARQ